MDVRSNFDSSQSESAIHVLGLYNPTGSITCINIQQNSMNGLCSTVPTEYDHHYSHVLCRASPNHSQLRLREYCMQVPHVSTKLKRSFSNTAWSVHCQPCGLGGAAWERPCSRPDAVTRTYRVIHQVSNYILLTLIWEFHHVVAYMPSRFGQICGCPSRLRQTS